MAWTDRYCSVSGGGTHDGTTAGNAWTFAEALAGYAAGHRINMLAGTYANAATARDAATNGTTTAPVWWRGYKATIGDMDGDPTSTRVPGTDIPLVTFTSGNMTATGVHQVFSSIAFLSTAYSARTFLAQGTNLKLHRCRFENQLASSGADAVYVNAGATIFADCYFKATASATDVVSNATGITNYLGCTFTGGVTSLLGGGSFNAAGCQFLSPSSYGVDLSNGGTNQVVGCTFYNTGSHGLRISSVGTSYLVANNIFSLIGGSGIANTSGTSTNVVHRVNNLFHACTAGWEFGFGDSPAFAPQSDSSSPFVAAGTDFTPAVGSNARNNAAPAYFEGISQASYGDIGAVRHPDPAGGGPTTVAPTSPVHGHTWHNIG